MEVSRFSCLGATRREYSYNNNNNNTPANILTINYNVLIESHLNEFSSSLADTREHREGWGL